MSGATGQLELARSVVERDEQRVAGEVQALARQRDGARETLERLDGYLTEYTGVERRADSGGRRSGEIMNARGFVARLHRAIAEQRRQLERMAERTAHKTAQWNRLRADLAAIDRVIERRRGEIRRDAARREQRELDAAGTRRLDGQGTPVGRSPGGPAFTSLLPAEHDT